MKATWEIPSLLLDEARRAAAEDGSWERLRAFIDEDRGS